MPQFQSLVSSGKCQCRLSYVFRTTSLRFTGTLRLRHPKFPIIPLSCLPRPGYSLLRICLVQFFLSTFRNVRLNPVVSQLASQLATLLNHAPSYIRVLYLHFTKLLQWLFIQPSFLLNPARSLHGRSDPSPYCAHLWFMAHLNTTFECWRPRRIRWEGDVRASQGEEKAKATGREDWL